MITNPLSMKTRGQLYVAAIVVGAVALVVTAILTTLGMEPWIPVVSSVASAMSVLAGTLGRDNLSSDAVADVKDAASEITEAVEAVRVGDLSHD